jgi:hypothetical protein
MSETRINVGAVVRAGRREELHMIYTYQLQYYEKVVCTIRDLVTYHQYSSTCFSPPQC